MYVIGLTGNAGSGKSYVCKCAIDLTHCPVIDSDAVCQELMMPGQPVYEEVVRVFGEDYLASDGTIDRAKLAAKVFADAGALSLLNSLTHPATIREIRRLLSQYEEEGYPVAFVESALADQAGYRDFCDALWIVIASEETRRRRLRLRGYSEERIDAVMSSQTPQSQLITPGMPMIVNDRDNNRYLILHQLQHYLDNAVGRAVWIAGKSPSIGCRQKEDMVY